MKPIKVLTVRQPWALAIVLGVKPVENRSWLTPYRGELFIHAGRTWEEPDVIYAVIDLLRAAGHRIPTTKPAQLAEWHPGAASGALVGRVNVTGMCSDGIAATNALFMPDSCDDWAQAGQHHWQVRDARALTEPIPMRGYQRIWSSTLPDGFDKLISA